MSCEDAPGCDLMFNATVVLVFDDERDDTVLIHAHSHDNHIARLVIKVRRHNGLVTLEMPFMAVVHTLPMLSEGNYFTTTFCLSRM